MTTPEREQPENPGTESNDSAYLHPDVPLAKVTHHEQWIETLAGLCNKPGKRVLEVGSRVVTGSNFRSRFDQAEYTGFDYHPGPNVDVVGDAHKLSSFFDRPFDLIFSSAVFEHFALPWVVAQEMIRLLSVGGYIFVETHYSYSSHERPWHFFQFSEQALKMLFPPAAGIKCIEAGVSNPIVGRFSSLACKYLAHRPVSGLYCHSGFLGLKKRDVPNFSYLDALDDLATEYPLKEGGGTK